MLREALVRLRIEGSRAGFAAVFCAWLLSTVKIIFVCNRMTPDALWPRLHVNQIIQLAVRPS
jgi:hypothetical protein